MPAYATASDMAARHDIELIGDLVGDDRAKLSRPAVLAHPNLATALEDASGEIEANLMAGARYTVEQLESLEGNSQSHLKRITCTIAMALLFERRPGANAEKADHYLDKRREYLDLLQAGKNLFGIPEHVEASLPSVDGPTAVEQINRRLLPERMGRYFPTPDQRLPSGRG